jgi:hypothetical protein
MNTEIEVPAQADDDMPAHLIRPQPAAPEAAETPAAIEPTEAQAEPTEVPIALEAGAPEAATTSVTELVTTIKVLIAKGDKAADKAQQFFISAGEHLKTLKSQHDEAGGTWAQWEVLLKGKVGIGKSRASELMLIADGRKTVEQARLESAGRKRLERTKSKSQSLLDVTEKPSPPDAEPATEPKPTSGQRIITGEQCLAEYAADEAGPPRS